MMSLQTTLAQTKKETIGTETVDVVKPYTPTISDAFKAKEIPDLEEENNTQKEILKYTIFSFPVASTFTPSKGNAQGVEKAKQDVLFKNYATFGIGNYGTLNGELYVTDDLNNVETIGAMFRHHSSQGGVKNIELENRFYDTSVDLNYSNIQKELSWNVDLGYQNQVYNWYGLPANFGSTLSPEDRKSLLNGINPQQSYNTISLDGKVAFADAILDDVTVKFSHFSDAFGSSENNFKAKPSFHIQVGNRTIQTNVIVDYLGGSFKNEYWKTNLQPLKYGFTNFGIEPSFIIQEDDWTLHIGTSLFYSLDAEQRNNKFLVYPKFRASYKVVGDLMLFYAGAEGTLEQNSYANFTNKNTFLSPTLLITPTDKQFEIYTGLKGKLSSNVSYDIRGSYVNERNKALFKSNDFTENSTNENYAFGNSMQVVYDNLKTLRFFGELKADFSKKMSFGINGSFSSYTNTIQNEAWNLPTIKLNSKLDFAITTKWYTGINVFYIGERKDQKLDSNTLTIDASPITLPSYFDVNAHIGYQYNQRLTTFLRANNITNQAYEKWLNYTVQGFQVVIGANYKFDF